MIVIVDTGVANRHSICNAFEFIGANVRLSSSHADIAAAEKLVLPGVGAFAAGMRALAERDLIGVLSEQALVTRKPILGVCLGMQLMAEASQEDGRHPGLGWIPGTVRRLEPADRECKVPHIGFNDITPIGQSPLFGAMPPRPDFYFVHSYHLDCPAPLVSAYCEHGGQFVAAVHQDNLMGVQFHPEKSQSSGLQLLRNFVAMEQH